MKLIKAQIQNYRSIRDTGVFNIEEGKTIIVGPNEAGKSATLQALQQINRPDDVQPFDELRDYPRALLNNITTKKVKPSDIPVATGWFSLDDNDINALPEDLRSYDIVYKYTRYLDDHATHEIEGGPDLLHYSEIENDLIRLSSHLNERVPDDQEKPNVSLNLIVKEFNANTNIQGNKATALAEWLQAAIPNVDEDNEKEESRLSALKEKISKVKARENGLKTLSSRMPVFVLFNNYFRVKPNIHLAKLAERIASDAFEDDQYDYGNMCLLKLLGLDASKLSAMGKTGIGPQGQDKELDVFRDDLDSRAYQLNSASIKLTKEITSAWNPNLEKGEAGTLRITSDGQYLKVVVVDDLGVEVELDQRSEGFQWLVSFFTVFFAEAEDQHDNSILLLDEPGMSLHALKQRTFRSTLSRLSQSNQMIFTTHSPFLVGPNELDAVRVVEMCDREVGTKIHTTITSSDPAALLPLQEALGYDLAQSLFSQERNIILEGLTDYWYLEATASLLDADKITKLNSKIALVPANSAGKVVYFATILHAQGFKVASLLDSDSAGDQAAEQDTLVHTLGNKNILRTKDFLSNNVKNSEIEDLLRNTLVSVAKDVFGTDVSTIAEEQTERSIVSIFENEIKDFSKYKLAKAYLKWTRDHSADDLFEDERSNWKKLITAINSALK